MLGARRELYEDKVRSVYWGQKVDLEDWLLPVVYRNQTVDLKLRRMYPEEETAYFTQQALRFQFGNQFTTTYGFVGRDLDILKLEKGLIRNGNVIMLYGMGGTGKTTLLRYLQDWWVLTGFVTGVSYFGYDDRAWNLSQILFNVATDVMTEVELRSFQSMPQVAQIGKLAQVLNTRRWLVVLDNLESVTGQALAIANTLTTAEQAEIRSFLGMLRGGQTRVVLGSRRREDWLSAVYGGNEYELRGLDGLARSELAEAVLKNHVKDAGKRRSIVADKDFARLMRLLAGYPLTIEVVLSNLGRQSVAEVLAGLDAADVRLDRVGNKTESILQCVEYSHGNLSASAQRSLLCLALFSGFVHRGFLPQYVKHLQAAGDAFGDLTIEALDSAVGEAINWGLLTPMDRAMPDLLTIQPIFPYFLKTKLLKQNETFQSVFRLGFKNHYEKLALFYDELMRSNVLQKHKNGVEFCKLEYNNIHKALHISLDRGELISMYGALDRYYESIQDFKSGLELAEEVLLKINLYPDSWKTKEGREEYSIFLNLIGHAYMKNQKYEKAYPVLCESLQICEAKNDIRSQAKTHHGLGIISFELRKYTESKQHYQKSLQLKSVLKDYHSQAKTYNQLGILAYELKDYEEARLFCEEALKIVIAHNDSHTEYLIYYQLGRIMQELKEYKEAEECYEQSLRLSISFADKSIQARIYQQRGMMSDQLQDYQAARKNYQQALKIKIELNDPYQSSTYHQLGMVAQELEEYGEARQNYTQALRLKIELGDRYAQASTYGQLGLLEEAEKKT
jgi:tetratricopeptide (TPR) repeat protein/type II secretory pathway predicted ATPase ExeA